MNFQSVFPITPALSRKFEGYAKVALQPSRQSHLQTREFLTEIPSVTYTLRKHQVMKLEVSQDSHLNIQCTSGLLWITEVDSADILLHPENTYQTQNPQGLVIQALSDSIFTIEEILD